MLYMEEYHHIGRFMRCFKICYFHFCCDFKWQLNGLHDWILDTYDGAYHFIDNDSLYFEHMLGADIYVGWQKCKLNEILDFEEYISSFKPVITETYKKIDKLSEIAAALQLKINIGRLTSRKKRIYVQKIDSMNAKMDKIEIRTHVALQKLFADFKNRSNYPKNMNA
jgi:hypothetical protein